MIFIKRFFKTADETAFKVIFAVFFALFVVFPVFSDQIPLFKLPQSTLYGSLGGPDDPLPVKADLRTGTLANGLRYYILPNSVPGNRAYLTLAVNAGSILENDDEQGLAHFLEHLAFNGTRRFPGMELISYLRSLGMRFGPEVNAYTSYEETVYGIETPVETGEDGIKRIPERALAILDDWTWAITLNPEDVDKERAVILEEYRTRLGAQERVRRQLLPVIFRGSRFAERNPIGLPEVIQNASAEQLKSFYRSWYRPDNMAIILVGDFDGAVLEKELAAHFTIPAAAAPFTRPYYELPDPQRGAVTTAVITDEELPNSTVYLYFKRSPKTISKTLYHHREMTIDYLVEMMIDFRYGEKIAAENTPYTAAGAWNSRFGQQSRFYIMAANAKAGRTDETLMALLLEKEKLLRYGFTPAELSRAKAALLSNLEMAVAEKDRRDSEGYIGDLTYDYLKEYIALDPEWELDAAQHILPGIGLGTVNFTVRNYYADDDITILISAPQAEAAGLPDEQAMIGMLKESRDAEIAPPRERVAVTSPVSEAVMPGTVVSVTKDPSGAEIWELSNGLKMILFETANKNNEFDFYALARGGTVSAVEILDDLGFTREEALNSAKLADEIQSDSGLGALSKPELMDYLSDKQLSLAFWTGSYTRGLQGSSTVKDLPSLFQMFHAAFAEPRIDKAGYIQVLDYHKSRLLREAENPEAVFSNELTRLIYGDHPAFNPLELAGLETVSENAALAFLTLALNPADYILVMAGSLGDRAELRTLTETWLASIPYQVIPRWNTWSDPGIRRPGKTEKIVRKGKEEKSIVYMSWFVPKTWTETDNAAVLALNEYLDIVLTDEIREKLGGVYSIFVRTSLTPMPTGELSLELYFVCNPKREAELRAAVKEQLASLAAAVDGETLTRAKEALVKTFERSMENNSFIARNLANFYLITGVPLSNLNRRPELYRSVQAEHIRSLIKELFEGGPAELLLLPETADN